MSLLLDTQLILWSAMRPDRLPKAARSAIEDAEVVPAFSAASIWEIAIKASLGRGDFEVDAARLRARLLAHGYTEIPVTGDHAMAIGTLPKLHGDPVDRLLLAQATVEGLTLLTTDRILARYPGPVRLV